MRTKFPLYKRDSCAHTAHINDGLLVDGSDTMATMTVGNPYTHYEITRTSMPGRIGLSSGCFWCGQHPRTLYSYNNDVRFFCNKKCAEAYFG